ncbi:ribose-phosphate pyrophosphokinase [Mycoplasma testudineum]|uniref:ribose-phosphate diphosphokinase n=1 Tax=Mycoplasma testudineum TaxID=244584 RepID=A0A4R6IDN2_9MOLU|nr:ribose-phosphate pyrophosphokinase [Mycoplasma testudineum]OYD26845.1 ribose-phosphate pyrophosphokinase [Mycoplasma testudineum]TDO20380.1 ribose-phosphate pyrophosphokinase [Mycoplasma testudineum]
MNKNNPVMLFGMPGSKKLSEQISEQLNIKLTGIKYTEFADGELMLSSEESVRNRDIFIITSTSLMVNKRIMELLIFVDSLKRASANSINVIFSYYGYARQDRKAKGRQPIVAKLVANLLETAGVTKAIVVDLHNPSIQGFFNIPVDDLRGQFVLASELVRRREKFNIVSPDYGGTVRARILAELISNDIKIAIVDKRRVGVNKTETLGLIGSVSGKNVVLVDDIIDTGGTIIKAAEMVKAKGAKKVIIAATHGIFTRGFEIFENCAAIDEVIVTDSIEQPYELSKYPKLTVVSLSTFVSQVIKAQMDNSSISSIYEAIRGAVKSEV